MRVFFVSDIHGSETCFRKLVNAGKFYGADLLIMGGDLAGKELVPVVERAGSWTARFRGTEFSLATLAEVAEFERRVATMGPYTLRTDPDFVAELARDQELVEKTLREEILERTERQVALAADRLGGTGIRLLIGLGNDDFEEMIPYLSLGPVGYAPDGLLDLGDFTLVSLGWSNITPWRTNRECTEEALADKLAVAHDSADPSPGPSSTSTCRRMTAASTSPPGWTSPCRSSSWGASQTWSRSVPRLSLSRSRRTSRCSACTATFTRAAE